MKTTLISHASVLIKTGTISILSDPWFESYVFNDSWALLADAAPINFQDIQYIYISHEHPDHFNFPTLRKIPAEVKKNISILYQNHASKRLDEALLKMGFKEVISLPLYKWTTIEGVQFYCGSVGSMDSFLVVRDHEHTILNLNDCVLNAKHYRYIKKQIGKIDMLYTQFSYANWVGNDSDYYNEAARKISDIRKQVDALQPDYTIPFASYVFFCNRENFWMNQFVNTPQKLVAANIPTLQVTAIGEEINLAAPTFNTTAALDFWLRQQDNISIRVSPPAYTIDDVQQSIVKMLDKLLAKYPFLRLTMKDLSIYLTDISCGVDISFGKKTVTVSNRNAATYRYTMCSQAAKYMFDFTWGSNSVMISGMFTDNKIGTPHHTFFFWQNLMNTQFINLSSFKNALATFHFFMAKRFEILYKYF